MSEKISNFKADLFFYLRLLTFLIQVIQFWPLNFLWQPWEKSFLCFLLKFSKRTDDKRSSSVSLTNTTFWPRTSIEVFQISINWNVIMFYLISTQTNIQTKIVISGHSNATRHSRGELMGVDKVSHEHFLLLNSDINALKAKKFCLRGKLGFKRHFLSNLFHSSKSCMF